MSKTPAASEDGIIDLESASTVQKYEKSKIYLELGRKVSITLATYLNGSFAAVVTFFMFFKPLLQQLRFIPILPLVGETANFLFHMRKLIFAPLSAMPLRTKLSIGSLIIISYLAATLAMTAGVLHGFGISLLAHVLPFNPLLFTISLGIHAALSTFKFAKTLINYIRHPEERSQLKTLRVVSQGVKATGMITLTSVMIPLMMATGAVFIVGGLSNPFTAGPVAIALFSVFATTCAVLVARKIIKTYVKHRLQERAVQKYLNAEKKGEAIPNHLIEEISQKPRSTLLLRLTKDIRNGKAINPNKLLGVSRIGRLPGLLFINYLWAKANAATPHEKNLITDAYNILNIRFLRNKYNKKFYPDSYIGEYGAFEQSNHNYAQLPTSIDDYLVPYEETPQAEAATQMPVTEQTEEVIAPSTQNSREATEDHSLQITEAPLRQPRVSAILPAGESPSSLPSSGSSPTKSSASFFYCKKDAEQEVQPIAIADPRPIKLLKVGRE